MQIFFVFSPKLSKMHQKRAPPITQERSVAGLNPVPNRRFLRKSSTSKRSWFSCRWQGPFVLRRRLGRRRCAPSLFCGLLQVPERLRNGCVLPTHLRPVGSLAPLSCECKGGCSLYWWLPLRGGLPTASCCSCVVHSYSVYSMRRIPSQCRLKMLL